LEPYLDLSSRQLTIKIKIRIYKTIILPMVLYVCETLSLTLREEQRLRVFENRVLRRIFGPKRDEVGPLGRPRRRWVDNIRMDLRVIG
jgi:hypothetical protein